MAKKKVTKKEYKLDSFKKTVKYKKDEYLTCSEGFLEATGIPGPIIGGLNMFLGHSDTGKTTGLIESMVATQKKDRFPVLIITEGKWNFSHAKEMGFVCEEVVDEETGELTYDGNYIFRDDFDTIEEITDFINAIFDAQEKGDLPEAIDVFWDSIGSVPCKQTFEGKGGTMHNARVLSEKIGMGLNRRINATRRADNPYSRTLVIVNQPWVDIDMSSPMSQPEIKAKGGNALWLACTFVFLFGQQKSGKASKVSATKDKRKFVYAKRTKISVLKNHDNGLGFEDGKAYVTGHGFLPFTDKAINAYKEKHKAYLRDKLGVKPDEDFDVDFETDPDDLIH